MDKVKHIAILASGRGSNARAIMEYFRNHQSVKVNLIVSNRKDAAVLDLADEYGIDRLVINREMLYQSAELDKILGLKKTDLIVLAGFLWLIPVRLIQKFPGRIINIHPALLPLYGGKGMYGHHVHEAVKASGDRESGITIHLVNEKYDEGAHIFQARCPLEADDSPGDIARKVLELEHFHYPRVIDRLLHADQK